MLGRKWSTSSGTTLSTLVSSGRALGVACTQQHLSKWLTVECRVSWFESESTTYPPATPILRRRRLDSGEPLKTICTVGVIFDHILRHRAQLIPTV